MSCARRRPSFAREARLGWALAWLACGCAGQMGQSAQGVGAAGAARPADEPCDPARDRAAVLAMAGAFRVSFAFDETEALQPGYALHEPYRATASEVVELIEEDDRRIVLQHVLLVSDESGRSNTMKHWRQDWTFQDRELLEFRGRETWRRRFLTDAEARCTWSQAVFQVDDGPRYESYGRWSHVAGQSTWTSQETWRPLPRREHTKRSDYDVLIGLNRHQITPGGWTHEQDNRKWVIAGARALARERGLNRYERVDLKSADLARVYLARTGSFWADVRAVWSVLLGAQAVVVVRREVDGKPPYEPLFALAEEIAAAPPEERRRRIRETLIPYLELPK
jgi:hypothetical protein